MKIQTILLSADRTNRLAGFSRAEALDSKESTCDNCSLFFEMCHVISFGVTDNEVLLLVVAGCFPGFHDEISEFRVEEHLK